MTDNKTKMLLVLGAIVFVLAGLWVKTTFVDKSTLITVVGEGKVTAKPQIVKFTISLLNKGNTATEAIADNNRLVNSMIVALKDVGVQEKDVTTSFVRLVPATAASGETQYQAVNTVDVTMRDIDKFEEVFGQLYKEGALSVSNIVFTVDNSRNLEKQAVNLAIEDARSRVGEMAKASGKQVGRMISVATAEAGEAGALTGKAQSGGSALPSQIEVVRQASIVFELR